MSVFVSVVPVRTDSTVPMVGAVDAPSDPPVKVAPAAKVIALVTA